MWMNVSRRVAASFVMLLIFAAPVMGAPAFKARLGGDKVMGTVQSVGAEGISVVTADGTVQVPPGRANYKLAGKRVEPAALTPGAPVEIDYKGVSGMVLGRDGNLISFQPDKAAAPFMLPLSFVHKSKVYVYTAKGDIVRVPIDDAIAMQGTAGTTVLGPDVPERYGYGRDDRAGFGGSIIFGSPWYGGGWGPGWYPRGGWGWGFGGRWGRW